MVLEITAFLALAIWSYLALGRGGFWRCAERDDGHPRPPAAWPRVAVVIPARDEAGGIDRCLISLFSQDYPGPWSVILIDDNSGRRHSQHLAARGGRLRCTKPNDNRMRETAAVRMDR